MSVGVNQLRLLSTAQVCEKLCISRTTLYELTAKSPELRRARRKLPNGQLRWFGPIIDDMIQNLPAAE